MAQVLKIFFHDACFDGTTSAAVFSAFYRSMIDKASDIRTVGMIHKDGDPFDDVPLDADDHACVDFRFCANPKMRWWFDHHATAFQPASLRDVFDNQRQPTWFYDPVAPSCAGLIAESLRKGWSWEPPPHLIEAVKWADIIDAAKFASAEEAVALNTPAQRLAAWLAHGRTRLDTADYIEWLSRESLTEVASRGEIAAQLKEVEAERGREMGALKQIGKWAGEVIVFDRFDDPGARNPGFLGYLLFPTCLYSVSATLGPKAIKISVGVNPWSSKPRRHDIGALCAQHGGGGHAVVGGVTLRPDEVPRARSTVAAMVRELNET